MRLRLLIAYDGANYSGWQIQEKNPPPPTVQGALERALFCICGGKIRVFGAGRTDSGVHAWGQTAHCDIPAAAALKCHDWRHSLNALLPGDIRILAATEVSEDFHARKSALAKTYVYQLWRQNEMLPPFLRKYVWACGSLNVEAMRACAPEFFGAHDFASFQNAGTPIVSTIREIISLEIGEDEPLPWLPAHYPLLSIRIKANGFLKQMARNLAGFLVYAGKGELAPRDIKGILQARDRRALKAPTAPAPGLFLARVHYGDAWAESTIKACG